MYIIPKDLESMFPGSIVNLFEEVDNIFYQFQAYLIENFSDDLIVVPLVNYTNQFCEYLNIKNHINRIGIHYVLRGITYN